MRGLSYWPTCPDSTAIAWLVNTSLFISCWLIYYMPPHYYIPRSVFHILYGNVNIVCDKILNVFCLILISCHCWKDYLHYMLIVLAFIKEYHFYYSLGLRLLYELFTCKCVYFSWPVLFCSNARKNSCQKVKHRLCILLFGSFIGSKAAFSSMLKSWAIASWITFFNDYCLQISIWNWIFNRKAISFMQHHIRMGISEVPADVISVVVLAAITAESRWELYFSAILKCSFTHLWLTCKLDFPHQ